LGLVTHGCTARRGPNFLSGPFCWGEWGGIIASMDAIHILAATKDGKNTELWAVAGTPQRALWQLRERLPSGWMVTLTGNSLTPKQATILDVRQDEPRKLRDGLVWPCHPKAVAFTTAFGCPLERSGRFRPVLLLAVLVPFRPVRPIGGPFWLRVALLGMAPI